MEKKNLNLLFASVFALVFLIGFASATITLTPSVTTLPQNSGSFNLTVSSNLNETINLNIPQVSDGSGHNIIFAPLAPLTLTDAPSSEIVTVTYSIDSGFNFEFGKTYNAILSASGSSSGATTKPLSFVSSGFCEYTNLGELKATIKNIKVTEGFGEKKEWFPFDTIQFDVLVENNGNEDVDNIAVEWGLYNTQSNQWTIDVDEETTLDLNDGKDDTVTITFTLNDKLDEDLVDMEEGTYVLYARATGEIANGDHEGDNTCSSDSDSGKLMVERDFVVLSNFEFPATVQCDAEFQFSADAWNVGSDDQNEVYVNVYNKELGVDQDITVGDIDSFDNSNFNFILKLPDDILEKTYSLTLTVYDENDDVYQNGNDDKAVFSVPLVVKGGCSVAKASITAVLESGGQAGKLMVVKATIVNTGKKASTYNLNVAGYTEWASSATLDKTSLTLNAGESAEVLLNFDVKNNVLGNKLFNFEIVSENQLIVSQPVQVEITKKKWGITGNLFSGDNKYIWGIGILNLILIILIIVIAVRIARK
jgi:hypothetical protein